MNSQMAAQPGLFSTLEVVAIVSISLFFFLFPIMDRLALAGLVKRETGRRVTIPLRRRPYRVMWLFGGGFMVGAFVLVGIFGITPLEGGFIGGIGAFGLDSIIWLLRTPPPKTTNRDPRELPDRQPRSNYEIAAKDG